MAALDVTGVVAVMFEADVTLTIDAGTFDLLKNTVIGIEDGTTSLTVSIATGALCMLAGDDNYNTRGTGFFVANTIRESA